MEFTCARSSRPIEDHQCCQIVLDTTKALELAICRTCERGQTLAKLCPVHHHFEDTMPEIATKITPVRRDEKGKTIQPQEKPLTLTDTSPEPKEVAIEPPKQKCERPKKPELVDKPVASPTQSDVIEEKSSVVHEILKYVLHHYPAFKTHGINFIYTIAHADFHYDKDVDALLSEFEQSGLRLIRRGKQQFLVVDDAAKSIAKAQ